jgi:uncharacterized protein (TIGR02246 family)
MGTGHEEAIAAVRAEHVEAVNSTDVDRLLAGMTDDVAYLAPQLPPIRGKDELRRFVAPIYAKASINVEMEAESLEVSGEHAVEWGNVRGAVVLEGADSEPVNLTYLFVYRLDSDGRWRISYDISTPGASTP